MGGGGGTEEGGHAEREEGSQAKREDKNGEEKDGEAEGRGVHEGQKREKRK